MNIIHPDWGFTPVSGKKPYLASWQQHPLSWDELCARRRPEDGIGFLPGNHARAITDAWVFVDFDGWFAFDFYQKSIGDLTAILNANAPMWSSGRDGRCQIMFRVDASYWPFVKTKKIVDPNPTPNTKPDGLEMRWKGCQSVIPPSIHPDTGQPYVWLTEPSQETILTAIPDDLLAWWLDLCNPTGTAPPDVCFDDPVSADEQDVADALAAFQRHRPRLGYDEWRSLTMCAVRELGEAAGFAMMRRYWPATFVGEYEKLCATRGWYSARLSPGLGTIIHKVREFEPSFTLWKCPGCAGAFTTPIRKPFTQKTF